jgi:hypothetical protein
MTAHDVRHLRACKHCGGLGDNRKMLKVSDGLWHDWCVVESLTVSQILQLPAAERGKITLGACFLRPVFSRCG